MADSPVFARIAEGLEGETSLDRLQSRGTLRLALKSGGLDPRDVSAAQMRVVLEKVLPGELRVRGVAEGVSVCERLARSLDDAERNEGETQSPDVIFARLGG